MRSEENLKLSDSEYCTLLFNVRLGLNVTCDNADKH